MSLNVSVIARAAVRRRSAYRSIETAGNINITQRTQKKVGIQWN
jgi:hypothetical protein